MRSNKYVKIWDKNAPLRHKQILSGIDVSYDNILVPTILNLIRDITTQKNTGILDVGCGSGIFTCKLSDYADFIVGVDYSPKSIEIAKEYKNDICSNMQRNIEFFCSSIENFESKRKFNIITANMVLHTVFDIVNAVESIVNNLLIGGRFIMTLPHPLFYTSRNIKGFEPEIEYIRPSTHNIEFSISNDSNPMPESTPFIHRPLSFYSLILFEHGLLIEKILEPYPDEKTMLKYPQKWSNPRFVAFQCIRKS
jgi:SAM-dependent methyltransferase